MSNFRNELNSNEKFARKIIGTDTEATFTVNGESADKILAREKKMKFNEKIDQMEKKLEKHMTEIEALADELAKNMESSEIVPVYGYVLIKPFAHNPFQKMVIDKKSGLILDTGGLTPEYKSEEDGEIHEEQEMIKVGLVIETGHKCEFVQNGDLVFYNDMMSAVNVPYYKLGLVAVAEQRIIAVVSEGVTARKEALALKNGNI